MTGQHARPRFNWPALRVSTVVASGLFLAAVVVYELLQIIAS